MEPQQPTPTIEDYLSLIYSFYFDHEKITGVKLAEYLGVSAPTVTATLQRMERDGWIEPGAKKQITLTEKGQKAAKAVIQRHNLVECLLFETLGMPLSSIHEEAHLIEHAISPETQSYLLNKFEHLAYSPFGMPISASSDETNDWKSLLNAQNGETLTIRRIIHYHCTREALQFLEQHQLVPGEKIEVITHHEFNQTFEVKNSSGQEISVGYPIARMIQVETL
jgi:DtxR family transcriptional regulator, Mn-dependent transcriptional regulator